MTPSSPVENARLRLALILLALLPIVVAVVWALTGDWLPVGDDGLLALRVDDVASSNHPWLGSWTSASLTLDEDVNNPGAWYAYLAAPPVALFGPIAGIAIAVGLLNGAAIVGLAWAGRALGGSRAELWFLAGAVALGWAMGSELLIDVWQPHALLLPVLFVLVLSAAVAAGRAQFLPWLLVTASIVIQTHLGHVYILSAMVAASLVAGAVTRWQTIRLGPGVLMRSRAVQLTIVGIVLAWLPSLIEQAQHGGDGNLARLLRNSGGGDVTLGVRHALGVVAGVFVAPWSRARFGNVLSGADPRAGTRETLEIPGLIPAWLALLLLLALGGLLGAMLRWARSTDRRGLRAALTMALVAIPATIAALSIMTVGVLLGAHHVRWTFAVAIFVQATLAWGVVEWLRAVRPRVEATLLAVVIIVVLALANLVPFAQDHGSVVDRWARPTLNEVVREFDDLTLESPVVFDTSVLRVFEPYSGPVMMLLGEHGVDFRVPDEWLFQVGRGRAIDGTETGRIYQIEGAAALHHQADDCQLMRVSGLSDDEEAEVRASVTDLADRLFEGRVEIASSLVAQDENYQHLVQTRDAGDRRGAEWVVLVGALAQWADAGALDAETTAVVADVDESIQEWVRSVYGLYLETDGPCPD